MGHSVFVMCKWYDTCSVIDGLQIFLLSWFYHCFWFDGMAGCYVIWCCHSSLFQKAFRTVFSWLLNGKRLVCFCVCIVSYVSHWACVYFCFGFSVAELILWCFPFGFRESSFSLPVFCLCFMVLNCIWWVCSPVCTKHGTPEGITWKWLPWGRWGLALFLERQVGQFKLGCIFVSFSELRKSYIIYRLLQKGILEIWHSAIWLSNLAYWWDCLAKWYCIYWVTTSAFVLMIDSANQWCAKF